jgi:LPXTG-motif cell wall-anchored protein
MPIENPPYGDLGPDSYTERALSITLLPILGDLLRLDLASATVQATDCRQGPNGPDKTRDVYLYKTGINVLDQWGPMTGSVWEIRENCPTLDATADPDHPTYHDEPYRLDCASQGDTDSLEDGIDPAHQFNAGGDPGAALHLAQLPPGTYWLTEVKSPAGFSILAQPVMIQVTSRVYDPGDPPEAHWLRYGTGWDSNGTTVQLGLAAELGIPGIPNSLALLVRDVPIRHLPETGGPGWLPFLLSAAVGLAAGGAGWLVWKRRASRVTLM